jgi:hypothetical protein
MDCIFVDSPPLGEDSLPAELILNPANVIEWKPHETMVPLVILLRHTARVTGLIIACSSPVRVFINSLEMQFEPPIMQQSFPKGLALRERVLECLISAPKIEISKFTIVGEVITPPFFEPGQIIQRRASFGDHALRRIGTNLEILDENWRQLRVPTDCAVHGFDFPTLPSFTELVVKYLPRDANSEWEIEHFRLPKCKEHCYLLLPNPVEMKECRLLLIRAAGDGAREFNVKLLGPPARALPPMVQPRVHF